MPIGIDDVLSDFASGLGSGLGSAGGDILGNIFGTAYGAHISRDLMSKQSTINRELWNESLLNGPSLQRQGLEAAGYNPLLALGGFSVPSINGVSISSAGGSISNLGSNAVSSAIEAMKANAGVKNTNSDTKLKGVQKEVAKKEVEVKKAEKESLESQKDLNKAREAQTKVDTVTEPLRLAKDVAVGAGSAYGAHKISKKIAEASKQKEYKEVVLPMLKKSKNTAVSSLQKFGLLALPYLIGAGTAYGLNKMYQHSSKNSNVRKLMDNPIRSPHF